MVDIPGDSTTTRTITVGGSISNTLETLGDHDWFRISLTAGESISVLLDGTTLEDPYLRIRDAQGNVLFEIDDIVSGVNRDSLLGFTATYTGTYYIDAAAWEDGYSGNYTLSVSAYTPPPMATIAQITDQLVNGYWSGDDRHFNVTQGGTITYNFTALTAAGQTLARAALATWTDIIGVNFTAVPTGGDITFVDIEEGAFSSSVSANGIISSSHINVSRQWLADNGTTLNGYSFQTYVHEIGHALGLGHAGNYNETARYPFEALFLNDGWPVTIMSYFDQTDNTYFAGQGFTQNFVTTPMMADIAAMSVLYGLSTTTRLGDTTYRLAFSDPMGAQCIFDSGGIDTIGAPHQTGSQINLNPGSFSNIYGEVGNLSIALGVIIENAVGGGGNDILIGNDVDNVLDGDYGNDSLSGGAGNDTLIGGRSDNVLNGGDGSDTADYVSGIGPVSANLALGTASNSGGEGNDTLTSIENLSGSHHDDTLMGNGFANFIKGNYGDDVINGGAGDDILEGGVQIDRLTGSTGNDMFRGTATDLSGDTITDFTAGDRIVISDANLAGFSFSLSGLTLTFTGGSLTLGSVPVGRIVASAVSAGGMQLSLQAASDPRNDFNGDGRSDILWRHADGRLTDWLSTASGGYAPNSANLNNRVANDWQVDSTGDFNGDGRDDIMWRNTDGRITNWLGTSTGGFADNVANAYNAVTNDWKVAGVGDFNGDGRDDILWRHNDGRLTDWLSTASGGYAPNSANAYTTVANDWQVASTGDFNGDGRDDIMWRNADGRITNWLGTATGGFADNVANAYNAVSIDWKVAGVGDFNGDGRDDILWRHNDGRLTDWLSTASGGYAPNSANAYTTVSNDWQVDNIGDYNGDGRDDIMWRHSDGRITNWLGTATGGFADNVANALNAVSNEWQVQPTDHLF